MLKRPKLFILGNVLLQSIHPCSSGPTFPSTHGSNEALHNYVGMELEHLAEPTNYQQELFNHHNPHEHPLKTPYMEDWRHQSWPDNSSPLFDTSWPHSPQNNPSQFPDWDLIHVPDADPYERPLDMSHVEDWLHHSRDNSSPLFDTSGSSSVHTPQSNLQVPGWDNIHVPDNDPHKRPLEMSHMQDWSHHSVLDYASPRSHTSNSVHFPQNNLQPQVSDWDYIHGTDSPEMFGHNDPPSLVTSHQATEETTNQLQQPAAQYEEGTRSMPNVLQNEHREVQPFDISGMRYKDFGWISTLKFWEKSGSTYLHVLVKMFNQAYQALRESSRPGVWTLTEILVASGRVSQVDAEQRLSALLFNVCARHTDLLAGLTAVAQDNPSQAMQIKIGIQEHKNLLGWFIGQVGYVNMQGYPATASGAAGVLLQKDTPKFSQPQRWLIDYLTRVPNTSELHHPRWRVAQQDTNQPTGSATMKVTLHEANLTHLAINLLGTFHKFMNPIKWLIIFPKDEHFVNFFVAQRSHWNDNKDTYLTAGSPINRQMHLLPIFPWAQPYTFNDNIPPEDFGINLFHISTAISNSPSNEIDKKFLNLPNQPHT